MKTFLDWLLARLAENSTWRGLVLLATAAGVKLDPDAAASIIAAGLAVVGAINVCRNSTPTPPPTP